MEQAANLGVLLADPVFASCLTALELPPGRRTRNACLDGRHRGGLDAGGIFVADAAHGLARTLVDRFDFGSQRRAVRGRFPRFRGASGR